MTFLMPWGVSLARTLLDIVGVLVVLSKGVLSWERVDLVESREAFGVALIDVSAGADAVVAVDSTLPVVAAESTLPRDSRELL